MSQENEIYNKQFEDLFKAYFEPLLNYINGQLKNIEDSREIVQNTFLKIWNYRGKIELDSPAIKSYLYTTAKNTLIDFVRKKKRQGNDKVDLASIETVLAQEDDNTLFSEYVFKSELLKAMNNLKPKTRKIFVLNKLEGYTYKEIAEYLNISKRAVEDNISRALGILRENLKNNPNLFD